MEPEGKHGTLRGPVGGGEKKERLCGDVLYLLSIGYLTMTSLSSAENHRWLKAMETGEARDKVPS